MDTVHDSQAFISHHLNMLERPSTPGTVSITAVTGVMHRVHMYHYPKVGSVIFK